MNVEIGHLIFDSELLNVLNNASMISPSFKSLNYSIYYYQLYYSIPYQLSHSICYQLYHSVQFKIKNSVQKSTQY